MCEIPFDFRLTLDLCSQTQDESLAGCPSLLHPNFCNFGQNWAAVVLLVHGTEGFQALSSVPSLQGLRGRYSACGKNSCVETFTLALSQNALAWDEDSRMPPFRRSAQTRKQAETEVTGDTDKADGSSRAHSSEVHDAEIPSQTCEVYGVPNCYQDHHNIENVNELKKLADLERRASTIIEDLHNAIFLQIPPGPVHSDIMRDGAELLEKYDPGCLQMTINESDVEHYSAITYYDRTAN
ncbi:hypothetical protein M405DRAFT_845574 [Rhizopogon salebrosus TDB-379]|nr:hypothetical protein M405DRAFT_845574 [Rhizopogon salebrosus TDB-379]